MAFERSGAWMQKKSVASLLFVPIGPYFRPLPGFNLKHRKGFQRVLDLLSLGVMVAALCSISCRRPAIAFACRSDLLLRFCDLSTSNIVRMYCSPPTWCFL